VNGRRLFVTLAAIALLLVFLPSSAARAEPALNVGSKRFSESYILGEIVAQLATTAGEAVVTHREGLGSTGIVAAALESGAIDVYVEYTGTIRREILRAGTSTALADLERDLAPRGLAVSVPLGFDDTYALAMRRDAAERLGVRTLSDLARQPALRLGLSHEFLQREDGWPALARAYALPFPAPRGLEHGLAYEALAASDVDVIDVYSTDAKIERYGLRVLVDDRRFFPEYQAVLLYRSDLPLRLPRTWSALQRLRGAVRAERMIAMNADAELRRQPFAEIAARFLHDDLALRDPPPPRAPPRGFVSALLGPDLGRLALDHALLVLVSLAAGVLAGIPLCILATRAPRLGQAILAGVGVVQTIPSLALFAFLIPLFHRIGTAPTLAALFLYSLLPGRGSIAPHRAAAGRAEHPLRSEDGGGDRRGDRHHRRLRRRGGLRRTDRLGAGVERQRSAPRGGRPFGDARARRAGALRAGGAVARVGRSAIEGSPRWGERRGRGGAPEIPADIGHRRVRRRASAGIDVA
jgi:osmoprotectant transport system permease protein